MILYRSLLSLLLLTCLASFAQAAPNSLKEVNELIKEKYPSIRHASSDDLIQWMKPGSGRDLIVLDAREQEEYEVSHLQNAKRASSIDMALVILFGHLKDTTVVIYDSVGLRSAKLVADLSTRGFSQVYTLDGAIFEWANRGLPLYRGDKKANKVHPYNLWWQRYLKEELRAPTPD